jgi:non-canonical poly(A) RNA polymerase PAPD5/7
LHKEICDFYEFVRPSQHEHRLRDDIIRRCARALHTRWPTSELASFGSFAAGLYLPTADMDLVLNSATFLRGFEPERNPKAFLDRAAMALNRDHIIEDGSLHVIRKARVPIIKFVDYKTKIHVDISFENITGITANATFQNWKSKYPALPYLVTIIKQLLLMRNLNEVFSGGLGGFSITCLVVNFLELHPEIQSGKLIPEQHMGQLLIEFLDLYGNNLDMKKTGLAMNPCSYILKVSHLRTH